MEDRLKQGDSVLILCTPEETKSDCDNLIKEIEKHVGEQGCASFENTENFLKDAQQSSSFDVVISGFTKPFFHDPSLMRECYRVLKPNGSFLFREALPQTSEDEQQKFVLYYATRLKINGFTVERPKPGTGANKSIDVVAYKPSFEINSQVKLKLPQVTAWKIQDIEDADLINEDNLLEDDDIPEKTVYHEKVCEPTNTEKRKACKNCTCGLAEKLNSENLNEKETPKSSCGNCYLGDAFRCSSCPYIGLPAFKPGEKVVIPSLD